MNYEKAPKENLEDKLKSQPDSKPQESDKYANLKKILDTEEFYKNSMYCGKIYGYGGNYDEIIYQNGKGPLGREFNDYNISTGVGPCCYDQYQKQLDELKKYK